jgi:hypothetical protein
VRGEVIRATPAIADRGGFFNGAYCQRFGVAVKKSFFEIFKIAPWTLA